MTGLDELQIKLKVCLVGEPAVGKTCLVRRFVYDDFQGDYTVTLGTRVAKKDLRLSSVGRDTGRVTLLIWDIMGQQGIREILREAYFQGAEGVLMVCDVTRPETLPELAGWRRAVRDVAGEIPSYLLATKIDLREEAKMREDDVKAVSENWMCPYGFTSAKTGEGVEEAFEGLTHLILDDRTLPGAGRRVRQ